MGPEGPDRSARAVQRDDIDTEISDADEASARAEEAWRVQLTEDWLLNPASR